MNHLTNAISGEYNTDARFSREITTIRTKKSHESPDSPQTLGNTHWLFPSTQRNYSRLRPATKARLPASGNPLPNRWPWSLTRSGHLLSSNSVDANSFNRGATAGSSSLLSLMSQRLILLDRRADEIINFLRIERQLEVNIGNECCGLAAITSHGHPRQAHYGSRRRGVTATARTRFHRRCRR